MAEESYESAPLLPIGEQRYLCVEYPGYVKSVKRAIDTLGGEKELAQAIQSERPVDLNFRKSDLFARPIKGDILPSTRLLVKVTRRVKRHRETGEIVELEGEEEDWKTEIMGSVVKTLRFRGMADYQRLIPATDPLVELKKSVLVGNTENLLNFDLKNKPESYTTHTPPPFFTVVETPFTYNYRQNAPVIRVRVKQPDGSYKIKLLNRSRTGARETTHIHYEDEKIPNQSWQKLHEIVDEKERETKEKVGQLFEERPVWTKFGILNTLPKKYEKYIHKVVPYFAYQVSDGPWRECWIKYGVDVRKDNKYAIYQIISVKRSATVGEKIEKKKRTEILSTFTVSPVEQMQSEKEKEEIAENKHIIDGVNPPAKKFFFQLCDILDPDLMHIINNKEYLRSKSNRVYGYYYACVFNRIRDVCRTKNQQFADTGKADPVPNADDGLKEAVLKEQQNDASGNTVDDDDDFNDREREELRVIERAARIATSNMDKPNSSKRLKDVVDDYMNQLDSHTGDFGNDIVEQEINDEDYDEDSDEDFDIYEDGIDPFGDNNDPMEED